MRVRLTSLFLAILVVPAVAYAEAHKADLSGGGSGGSGGSAIGGFWQSIAFDWPIGKCGWCSPVADLSVQFGRHQVEGQQTDNALTQVAYQGGFRASLGGLAASIRRKGRQVEEQDPQLKIFLQVLAGAVYTNDGTSHNDDKSPGTTNGAITFGGGFQYFFGKAMPEGGTVLHAAGWGVQAQVDHIWRADRESFTRVSGGVTYRFLKSHKH